MQTPPQLRFLMCRPAHLAVTYIINPWMDPASWARDRRAHLAAMREWHALRDKLEELGARVELVAPAPGLPDLVFTANAGVVLDRRVLLARFRHPQRGQEEPRFETAFRELQARDHIDSVHKLPSGLVLEGAGDCVFDATRGLFWMGYGPRSDAAAQHVVRNLFAQEVVALELADARFYHMDTALCPLSGGEVMYLPSAFTAAGRAVIHEHVRAEDRIEIKMADGCRLAANAVCVGRSLIMSAASTRLRTELTARGYRVVEIPLPSFLRSGGSAFCLTLRLDRHSREVGASERAVA